MDDIGETIVKKAGEVSRFLMKLSQKYPQRWDALGDTMPYGDLAYGNALVNWEQNGKHIDSFFSYAGGEVPCPFMIEFRLELTQKFGLPVFTQEEAEVYKEAMSKTKSLVNRIEDWGLN